MFEIFNKFFKSSDNIKYRFLELQKELKIKKIFQAIENFSKEGEIRYVGGCVRKILNNESVDDIDLATNLKPDEVKKALQKNNIKFYETGIEHGTITAILDHKKYEITSLRSDITTDGRHAKVQFTKNWLQDAERRDFTINSIYSDIDGNLFDPFGGKKDLLDGKIIFVGDVEKRIKEYYLRILRYLRFFSNYSKKDHNKLILTSIKKNLNGISKISSERLLDEFRKIFQSHSLEKLCKDSNSFEILKLIFPQFKNLEVMKRLSAKAREKLKYIDYTFLLGVLTIDDTDNLDYFLFKFNISNKDKTRLISIRNFIYNKKKLEKINHKILWKHYYMNGKQSLVDILNFKIFFSKEDKKITELINYFKDKEVPVFPIKAVDLMKKFNLSEGKKLGDNLKIVEEYWINNNFKISDKELDKIVIR